MVRPNSDYSSLSSITSTHTVVLEFLLSSATRWLVRHQVLLQAKRRQHHELRISSAARQPRGSGLFRHTSTLRCQAQTRAPQKPAHPSVFTANDLQAEHKTGFPLTSQHDYPLGHQLDPAVYKSTQTLTPSILFSSGGALHHFSTHRHSG